MKNGKSLERFATVVKLLREKPRTAMELVHLVYDEVKGNNNERHTIGGHLRALEAVGLARISGTSQPHPSNGMRQYVWEWIED